MFRRQRSGAVLCPACGQLVGVNDERCFHCGRLRPGLFGFSGLLRNLGHDMGFVPLVLWACGALFISTLAVNVGGVSNTGLLSVLSPSSESLFLFGASGAVPVFRFGRWWTVLSAGWLHGGLVHIAFNMLWVRDLAPAVAQLYGAARTVILYSVGSIAGFAASSAAGWYLAFLPRPLRGAGLTIGASAAIFGLIGALLYYGRRSGSRMIGEAAKRWALGGLAMGFLLPGIDNWAHLGGLAGGYLAARWLDPLQPERTDHVLAAGACLLLSAAAVVASVVLGLSVVRGEP
jgi:rhomboid protease GluP